MPPRPDLFFAQMLSVLNSISEGVNSLTFEVRSSLNRLEQATALYTAEQVTTSKNVTLTTSVSLVAEKNIKRLSLLIVNDSAEDVLVYLLDSVFSSSEPSLVITAGGSTLTLGRATDFPYTGRVWAAAKTSSASLRVVEISYGA